MALTTDFVEAGFYEFFYIEKTAGKKRTIGSPVFIYLLKYILSH